MHMQSLGKELLHSLPVEVEFAGFRGNTLGLAKAGWDLSMQQQESSPWGEYHMRLAMRHSGAQLYAISHPVTLPLAQIHAGMSDPLHYAELLAHIHFSIANVAGDIRFTSQSVRHSGLSFASQFSPIDPYPQRRIIEESITQFKFFKIANPSIKDIIVDPSQVPELLDMVLRAQMPTVDQIKARERSRANTEWVRENMHGTKPAHHVQAQIITLAS